MAILSNTTSGHKIFLRASHLVGRNPARCDTVLTHADASQLHASIRWTGQLWELIDHSRNGTLANGKLLGNNSKTTLAVGQILQFAPGAPSAWRVECVLRPQTMLVPEAEGASPLLLQQAHMLPDEQSPQACVYLSAQGQWMCETSTHSTVLADGDWVRLGAHAWRFFSDPVLDATCDVALPSTSNSKPVCFHFTVSQDEEHTRLTLAHEQHSMDLGERTHHYCLLTLARQRIADASRGLDAASQGWLDMDRLSSMLGLDTSHLNIQIFRARTQISRALSDAGHTANVIERRRGQLRLGALAVRIVHGTRIEHTFTPPLA